MQSDGLGTMELKVIGYAHASGAIHERPGTDRPVSVPLELGERREDVRSPELQA